MPALARVLETASGSAIRNDDDNVLCDLCVRFLARQLTRKVEGAED